MQSMRKYLQFTYLVIFCFIAAALSFKYYLVGEVVKQINTFANHLDNRYVQIKYDVAENTCVFSVCVELKNVHVRFVNTSVNAGDVLIELPIDYPIKAFIDTRNITDHTDFIIHGVYGNNRLIFSNVSARLNDFSVEMVGDVDPFTGQIAMQATTQNLGPFVLPYMPSHMRGFIRLFFTNGTQLVNISSQNGWILVQGIPIFPWDLTQEPSLPKQLPNQVENDISKMNKSLLSSDTNEKMDEEVSPDLKTPTTD